MCFIAATCAMIVWAPRARVSWSGAGELRRELSLEPLGRQLDRRQRILDLVREPAGHLAPRGIALRLREIGDVVEHDDVARRGIDRQPRAAHQQRAHQVGHGELRLLLPMRVAAAAKAFRDELGERGERRELAPPVRQRRRRSAPPAAAAGSPPRSRWPCAAGSRRRTRARRPTGCRECSRGRRAWSRWRGATPRSSVAPRAAARTSC